MAEVTISREAVDAGARAFVAQMYNKLGFKTPFDELTDIEKLNARETTAAMFDAAAPLLVAAELERMASLLRVQARLCPCTRGGEWRQGPNCINHSHANTVQRVEEYLTRAAELRAQS